MDGRVSIQVLLRPDMKHLDGSHHHHKPSVRDPVEPVPGVMFPTGTITRSVWERNGEDDEPAANLQIAELCVCSRFNKTATINNLSLAQRNGSDYLASTAAQSVCWTGEGSKGKLVG